VQGYGPQFLQNLQEQRERPQREYQQQLQQYEQRKSRLGLEGLQAAQSAEERRQDRESRAAEKQFDRDFESFIRRNNITDQMAIEKMREAREIQLTRERERIQDERQQATINAQKERDARQFENQLTTKDGAPPKLAKEIAQYTVGLIPELSPAAEKWRSLQAQKAEAQLRRLNAVGGSGGGSGGNVQATLVGSNGEVLGTLPYSKIKFNNLGEPEGFPPGTRIRLQNQPQQPQGPLPLPGEQGSPYAGPPVPSAPQTPQTPERPKMTRAQAKAKLRANGFSNAEAEKELNRLGF
jgi:hypothetical protein